MASIKLKFRPSACKGKEGTLFFQLIQGRTVRRMRSKFRIFNEEWDSAAGQIVEATTTDFTIGAGYKIANFNTILKLRGSQTGVSNDLTINADFSFRKNQSLIRRIEQNFTQATSGTRTTMVELTANYVLSKRITVGAYFDHQINTPLVSSSSYPITNSNYGISIQLSLVK